MKTKLEALKIRDAFLERHGGLPSSLRLPLGRVMDGTEEPGTAKDVLSIAYTILLEWDKEEGFAE